jgi:hypothetical protein
MIEFTIPAKDVSANALGLCLGGPEPEDQLADTVFIPAHQPDDGQQLCLRLCIIGASHVAELLDRDNTVVFREEVSCAAQQHGGEPLRDTQERALTHSHGNYRFHAEYLCYSPEGFATAAADLCAVFDDDWLVGTFPGEGKYHITALFGMPQHDGWLWDTYHFYPNDYTVVHTTSTFQPPSQRATTS